MEVCGYVSQYAIILPLTKPYLFGVNFVSFEVVQRFTAPLYLPNGTQTWRLTFHFSTTTFLKVSMTFLIEDNMATKALYITKSFLVAPHSSLGMVFLSTFCLTQERHLLFDPTSETMWK